MDLHKLKSVQENLYTHKEQDSFKLDITRHTIRAEREAKKRGTFYGFGKEDTKEVTSTKKAAKSKSKPGKIKRALRKMGLSKAPVEEQQPDFTRELTPEEEMLNQQELDSKISQINALSDMQGDAMVVVGMSSYHGKEVPLKSLNKENTNSFYLKMKEQGDLDNATYSKEGRAAFLSYKDQVEPSSKEFDYQQINTLLRNDALEDNKKSKLTLSQAHKEYNDAYEAEKNKLEYSADFQKLSVEEQDKILDELDAKQLKAFHQKSSTSKEVVKATQDAIKEISKHKLKEDMALFRHATADCLGVILGLPWGTPAEEIDKKISDFNKGKTIVHDKAFLSTSMFRDGADSFKMAGGVEVRILAHKGTEAVNISRLTDKEGKISNMQDDEQEMLLQAGTHMRILRVEKPKPEGDDPKPQGYIIYMETVPEMAPLAGRKSKKKR